MNDMFPEEQDPQYEELIALLRRVDLNPLLVDPTESAQVISNAKDRLFPTDHEASQPEDMSAHDMQELGFFPSKPKTPAGKQHRSGRLVHVFSNLAAVLLVAVLIGATLFILKSPMVGRTGTNPIVPVSCNTTPNGFPTLTLSPNAASPGSKVTATLKHFAPSTHVVLTHDIQMPFSINGSSSITTDVQGCATFTFVIDTTWGTGLHLVVAEDVNTRLTASANLKVIGFTISGTVIACADQACATSQPLAGATVTLISGSTTVATTTADSSGTYSFSNMPQGRYTITVAGHDASNTHYVGSLPLTLTGNTLNTTIQALPG